MWYFIIVAIVSLGLLVGYNACKTNSAKNTQLFIKPMDTIKGFTRTELEEKLKIIANTSVQLSPPVHAMCYEIAAPPDRVEYICPVCNERSIYANLGGQELIYSISYCRTLANHLKNINAHLDELQFCKKCSPNVNEPELFLVTKLNGETNEYKAEINSTEDLIILNEFLSGELIHKTSFAEEIPLKDNIARIEQLLGVKLK